jgi:hypothetical protein
VESTSYTTKESTNIFCIFSYTVCFKYEISKASATLDMDVDILQLTFIGPKE